ncbi:MAG TPA: PEP-CTERM sorting domain-containing protein [Pyrinomonadaceae bacterium]|nr:PEP-CTERM sorting domain-containing protein [Pyrinomonadaceae bacterium]
MLRKAAFASFAFSLLFFSLLFSTREARADAIAITSGQYSTSSPWLDIPVYKSFGYTLNGNNFHTGGGQGDGPSYPAGTNCGHPCLAGSSFSLNTQGGLATFGLPTILQVNGQSHFGYAFGTLSFTTDSMMIPLGAGPELTLTASFVMSGDYSFQEIDPNGTGPTGYTFSSDVTGAGIASVYLVFSRTTQSYEVISASYKFTAVPEPATMILLGTGLAGIAARGRKRRRARKQDESLN